jgi:hypothetical protein
LDQERNGLSGHEVRLAPLFGSLIHASSLVRLDSMLCHWIAVRGARVHNLKDIDVNSRAELAEGRSKVNQANRPGEPPGAKR